MPTIELETISDQDISLEKCCESSDHDAYIWGHSDANDILWYVIIKCACNLGLIIECDGWVQDTLAIRATRRKHGWPGDYTCIICHRDTYVDILEKVQ